MTLTLGWSLGWIIPDFFPATWRDWCYDSYTRTWPRMPRLLWTWPDQTYVTRAWPDQTCVTRAWPGVPEHECISRTWWFDFAPNFADMIECDNLDSPRLISPLNLLGIFTRVITTPTFNVCVSASPKKREFPSRISNNSANFSTTWMTSPSPWGCTRLRVGHCLDYNGYWKYKR